MDSLQQKCNLKILQKLRFKKQKEMNKFYLESLKKIQNILFYYNNKYKIDIEELEGVARISFCNALKYKKEKNEFNFLFKKIMFNKIMNNIIRERIKSEKLKKRLKENKKNIYYTQKLNHLSEEANEVVNLIYNAPQELFSSMNKITQQKIRNYLRKNKNWKFEKINSIFDEIKMFLKEEF